MSASKFVLQSKVWHSDDKDRAGTVIGYSFKNPNLIAVEWDDGTLVMIHFDYLLSEKDMQLELEFKATNAKLAEAARLLAEVAVEANKLGKELHEYNPDTDELYFPALDDFDDAMRDAGWNTSSLRC